MTTLPVSMSVLKSFEPLLGLSMFMRRSRDISMSLLGVKLLPPFLGVILKEVPVSCVHNNQTQARGFF